MGSMGPFPIRFITWQLVSPKAGGGFSLLSAPNSQTMALITLWVDTGATPVPFPHSFPIWDYRTENITYIIKADKNGAEQLPLLQFFVALLEFMSQKIIHVSSPQKPSRAVLRRMENNESSFYREVTLRAVQDVSAIEPQGGKLTKRFVVRGHWRNQWYPSTETHRAIWILSHLKGPEHMKVENPEVIFNVSR